MSLNYFVEDYSWSDSNHECVEFSDLLGKSINVIQSNDSYIVFYADDGIEYHMFHYQDCCESVYIESIVGDIMDIMGEPILVAEEVINRQQDPDGYESSTYTFYKLATRKGYVDIRWVGTSNGYYSETVSLYKRNTNESHSEQ